MSEIASECPACAALRRRCDGCDVMFMRAEVERLSRWAREWGAAKKERAAIVAWLRLGLRGTSDEDGYHGKMYADMIERGEHLR